MSVLMVVGEETSSWWEKSATCSQVDVTSPSNQGKCHNTHLDACIYSRV